MRMNIVKILELNYSARREARDQELKERLSVLCTREEMLAKINGLKGLNVSERQAALFHARKLVSNR